MGDTCIVEVQIMGWRNIFRTSVFEFLKVASEICLFFHWPKFAKIPEFCDHYFSVASDYIIVKLDKAPVVDTSQILF